MIRAFYSLVILTALVFFQSCSKNDDPVPQNASGPLLTKIEWKDQNASASFEYNTDNSQRQIIYDTPYGIDTLNFAYANSKLATITSTRSLKISQYAYNEKNQVSNITMSSIYSIAKYQFEYTYTSIGKVASLKYYLLNEGGKHLIYNSVYDYDSAGDLSKITSTDKNKQQIIILIKSYSEKTLFNPWPFISTTDLEEMYELYNYPVLNSLKKLPKRVEKIIQGNKSIYETDFTINSLKLGKTLSSNYYEDDPGNKVTMEATYFYNN
ncbi:hypothetical protein [Pinibacter soli]|uniref:DUF4595 domain-containing protein n=1 Tax=Pinibacter soli TaxID=3044211 RepID=A0ABT6R7I2_9BACT|nr:hypothetical protein [Pinibacter soli]MDI3318421.1 hypothetical protein [Pinibacter soli]